MNFTVLSRAMALTYVPGMPAILIGITEWEAKPMVYPGTYLDILRLRFDDVDQTFDAEGGFKLFDEGQARAILDFVDKYKDQVDEIVVHCGAGVSRSAGVAAALCLVFDQEDAEFFILPYLPNRHVYRTIWKVWMGYTS